MRNPPKPCRRGRAAPVRNLRTKRPRVYARAGGLGGAAAVTGARGAGGCPTLLQNTIHRNREHGVMCTGDGSLTPPLLPTVAPTRVPTVHSLPPSLLLPLPVSLLYTPSLPLSQVASPPRSVASLSIGWPRRVRGKRKRHELRERRKLQGRQGWEEPHVARAQGRALPSPSACPISTG